jgi:hypothetical protein
MKFKPVMIRKIFGIISFPSIIILSRKHSFKIKIGTFTRTYNKLILFKNFESVWPHFEMFFTNWTNARNHNIHGIKNINTL